jgi:Tol biopolymer transport system component
MPILAATLFLAAGAASPVTMVQDSYPALSPDGQTLLFQSTRNGRWALYTSKPDGSEVTLLLDSGDDPVTPSWSPDGAMIAFAATVDGQSEIFVMKRDAKGRQRLTSDPGDDSHPHWSADGRLYFNSPRATPDRSADWSDQHHDIYSMTADGTDIQRHTDCKAVCTFPSPSPDGNYLAFRKVFREPARNWDQSIGDRNSEIVVKDMKTGAERNLSVDPAFDGWPVWTPNSMWVVFASNRGGRPNVGQIYAARPEGGAIRQLTDDQWSNAQPFVTADNANLLTYRLIETADAEFGHIGKIALTLPLSAAD